MNYLYHQILIHLNFYQLKYYNSLVHNLYQLVENIVYYKNAYPHNSEANIHNINY
ncbi:MULTISPECIES: hypothetical protein [Empedobacter]|uniref:hypothetical protein n=1 Tax=Empedobacter TaxID=59734 RepID=UPI00145784CD|nr:hypothetical protein [Empedobacter tilapiae]